MCVSYICFFSFHCVLCLTFFYICKERNPPFVVNLTKFKRIVFSWKSECLLQKGECSWFEWPCWSLKNMLPLFHLNCLHAYHCKWCLPVNFSCTSKTLVMTHAEHSCASTIRIDMWYLINFNYSQIIMWKSLKLANYHASLFPCTSGKSSYHYRVQKPQVLNTAE